jgi:hypothetical protein
MHGQGQDERGDTEGGADEARIRSRAVEIASSEEWINGGEGEWQVKLDKTAALKRTIRLI